MLIVYKNIFKIDIAYNCMFAAVKIQLHINNMEIGVKDKYLNLCAFV